MLFSPERRIQLVRQLPVQVFDEARPMMLTGDDDRGLEPEHDEQEGDEIEFPVEGAGGLLGKIKAKRPTQRPGIIFIIRRTHNSLGEFHQQHYVNHTQADLNNNYTCSFIRLLY
jgi:hypothetical protein